jgi:hypothetical protein
MTVHLRALKAWLANKDSRLLAGAVAYYHSCCCIAMLLLRWRFVWQVACAAEYRCCC